MDQIDQMFKDINNIYSIIAKDAYPNGATLICNKCTEFKEITVEECASYLKNGWPIHCETDMIVMRK